MRGRHGIIVEPNFERQPGLLEGRGPDFLSAPRARDMTIGVETAGLSRLAFPGGALDGAVHRAGVFAVAAPTFAGPVPRQSAVLVAMA